MLREIYMLYMLLQ